MRLKAYATDTPATSKEVKRAALAFIRNGGTLIQDGYRVDETAMCPLTVTAIARGYRGSTERLIKTVLEQEDHSDDMPKLLADILCWDVKLVNKFVELWDSLPYFVSERESINLVFEALYANKS